jgi:hypothetical protein
VPADALAALRKRTEALSATLRPAPRPAFLRAPVRPAALPAPSEAVASAVGGPAGAPAPDAGAALRRRAAAPPPSADVAATLRRHAALQEDLTDEMVEMAAGLKRNALAMDAGLRASIRVLDAVEARAPAALAAARRVRTRVGCGTRV